MLGLRRAGRAGRPRRAGRIYSVMALSAAVCALAGLLIATRVKSPAEVAAETRPPTPTLLTAQVVRQPIHSTVVFRGTVANARQFTANAGGQPVNAAAPGTGAAAAGQPVITSTPRAVGQSVGLGEVLVEVSGRPLILLRGDTPAYRDLKPGETGRDVAELQSSLRELGHGTGSDASGTYGAGTRSAVAALYRSLGYTALDAGDPAALDAAHKALTQAQRALATAQATPQQAGGVSQATQIQWARQDVATAQAAYDALLAAAGSMVPLSEVMFVPQVPATLVALGGPVGGALKDPVVTVAVGAPAITGRLDPGAAPQVKAGQTVQVTDDMRGYRGTGRVTGVGALTTDKSGNGSGAPYVPISIVVDDLPQNLVGDDVQLGIDLNAGRTDPVLAVPQAAVFARTDGRLYVTVVGAGGTRTDVPVTAGVSGDGLVEVTAADGQRLAEGDSVVLGTTTTP